MIPAVELRPAAEIKALREAKLRELMTYLQAHSSFYQRHFRTHGIDPADIRHLEDLHRIPVTEKHDLQQYNDDFICVPRREIADFVTTSGTLGSPVTFALTDADLDRLAYNEAVSFACAGVQKGDVIQLMTTIDRRFMAGLAYFLGARLLGAAIIRTGAGIPELQWDSILKFKPDYIIVVPSFLLKLLAYAEKNGIDYQNCGIKGAICIGEALRNQDFTPNTLGRKIGEKWDLPLYSTYASTEMSTAFTECSAQRGGHEHPELIITEILDADNQPVRPGEIGELTVTTLGTEAMPLLRFKTGDLVQAHNTPCPCGRTTARLGPVLGRKKQMVKYKGTTLYPPALFDLLNDFDEIENYIVEFYTNELGTDEILLKIGIKQPTHTFLPKLRDRFRAKLRVLPQFEFCDIGEINRLRFPKMSRKPVLLIDRREGV